MRVITFKQMKPEKGITYSPEHLGRMEKAGTFPKSIALGPGRKAWIEDEIDEWLRQRMAARSTSTAA